MKIPIGGVYKLRLYNTYFLCKKLVGVFESTQTSTRTTAPGHVIYYLDGWDKYVEALESLSQIPMFEKTAKEIYKTIPVFERQESRPEISQETSKQFELQNESLVCQMEAVINLYESMGLAGEKQGIDIKIPDCTELKEYIWYLKELDFVFTQCPYLLNGEEQIQFSSVDVGSNWLSFIVVASAGVTGACYILNNLAALLDKAIVLKSHLISLKEQEEVLRAKEIKNGLGEEEIGLFTALKKHYLGEAVTALEEEIEPLEDGEQRGRAEKSLEKLSTLLDKGVEIYASLDSPKDIQLLFPELGEAERLPENILRLLEDKKME